MNQTTQRTKLLILLLALVAGFLVFYSFSQLKQPVQVLQTPPIKQTVVPTESVAQTTLALAPNPVMVSSSSATVDVVIDTGKTGKNKITAVQLELTFDPKRITAISMTPGTFFQNPIVMLNQVDVKSGKATFAMGIAPTGNPPTGKGTVAKLNLRVAPNESPTELVLLPTSLTTAEGVSQSVLKSAVGTQILFQ